MGRWRWPRDRASRLSGLPGAGSDRVALEPGARLVAECDAFLSGHLAERLSQDGPLPAWVWTNLLAHASEEVLRAECRRTPRGPWEAHRADLAGLVLDVAAACGSLGDLQREVLIPLELELASDPDASPGDARRWAASVAAALDRSRRARRRPQRAAGQPPPQDDDPGV
jgi:hypothetical protein